MNVYIELNMVIINLYHGAMINVFSARRFYFFFLPFLKHVWHLEVLK